MLTALMVAAYRGNGEVVDMLIKAKADVNQKSTDVRIAISTFHINIAKISNRTLDYLIFC